VLGDVAAAVLLKQPKTTSIRSLTNGPDSSARPFYLDLEAVTEIFDIINTAIITDELPLAAFAAWQVLVFILDWKVGKPEEDTDHDFLKSDLLTSIASYAFDVFRVFDEINPIAEAINYHYRGSVNTEFDGLIREIVLHSLNVTLETDLVVYNSDILMAVLVTLSGGTSYIESSDQVVLSDTQKVVIRKLAAPFWQATESRFPYETREFVILSRALFAFCPLGDPAAGPMFEHMSLFEDFTEVIHPEFEFYEQADTETWAADKDILVLTNDLPVFLTKDALGRTTSARNFPVSQALTTFVDTEWQNAWGIEAGIQGEARNSEKPLVVSWTMKYAPISYLVNLLSTAVPGSNSIIYSSMDTIHPDLIVDIIRLLATILQAAHISAENEKSPIYSFAQEILKSRFADRENERDLITIVYEIFESNLQKQKAENEYLVTTDILSACLEFFHAMTNFAPLRIWPILVRSQLLNLDQGEAALETVIANSEVLKGDFSFLLRAVKLFNVLIDLAWTQQHGKPPSVKKTLTRLANSAQGIQFTVPPKTIRVVMKTFFIKIAAAFDASHHWRFTDLKQKSELHSLVLASFTKILRVTYGFDEEPDLEKKFSKSLADCSQLLASTLLQADGSSSGLCTSILRVALQPLPTPTLASQQYVNGLEQGSIAALELCWTALRIGAQNQLPISYLESRLFKEAPVLAKLFATSDALQITISKLLEVLLLVAAERDGTTPSLPGHMGQAVATHFLSTLSYLRRTVSNSEKDLALWRFITQVLKSQQQWFAVFLLTGRRPRGSQPVEESQERSVLTFALDKLSGITGIQWHHLRVPIAQLEFVKQAYSVWPISAKPIRTHKHFLPTITSCFGKLRREPGTLPLEACMEASAASVIAELITMYLYNCREVGDFKFASSLVNKLGYFKNYGFVLPEMRSNQQAFLRRNLAGIYPGVSLSQMAHTHIFSTETGDDFAYDAGIALKLIESAKGHGDHLGFAKEIQWANINLSELDVQLKLQKKCTLLAIELAQVVGRDAEYVLAGPLLDVVRECCTDFKNATLPTGVKEQFQNSQIELMEIILQKLVRIKSDKLNAELVAVFKDIWLAFGNAVPSDSINLFSSPNAALHRAFLRIIFLALQPLTKRNVDGSLSVNGSSSKLLQPRYFPDLVTIASDILPKGFKDLAQLAHSQSASTTSTSSVSPKDFHLLTSILQTILSVPGIESQHAALALNLANTNLPRYALNLFSWADQLLVNGEPIYAAPAVNLLKQLASLPPLAETLAASGILVQLSSVNLMSLFARPGGVGPFDTPRGLHALWVRGILPICLQLLDAVGVPVVPEVLAFLAGYKNQTDRLVTQLQNRRLNDIGPRKGQSHLTLTMAAEAHSLALISAIVEGLKGSAAAVGVEGFAVGVEGLEVSWDRAVLKEEVDDWLGEGEGLRRWILPADETEAGWAAEVNGSESRLQRDVKRELRGAGACLGIGG
jgi:nuclear pore complex protein Nup188